VNDVIQSHTYISPQIHSENKIGNSNQEKEEERSSEEKKGGKEESGGKGDKRENRIQNKKRECVYLSCSLKR